jgi:hypothetical protein
MKCYDGITCQPVGRPLASSDRGASLIGRYWCHESVAAAPSMIVVLAGSSRHLRVRSGTPLLEPRHLLKRSQRLSERQ